MSVMTAGTTTCNCGKTISANKTACADCLSAQTTGCLEILNVQGGDIKISFDKKNPGEAIRARRIISDMLRRGFALLVEVDRNGKKAYERVTHFDEAAGEYIIADLDPVQAEATVNDPIDSGPTLKRDDSAMCECGRPQGHRGAHRGPRKTRRLAMSATKAVGIGRTAGG